MSRFHSLLCAAALLGVTAGIGFAHDVKVLASRYFLDGTGGKSTIYLSWGHRLPVDDLIDADSLERFDLVGVKGQSSPLQKSGRSLQTNVVELADSGLYQVVLDRKASVYTYVIDEDGKRQLKRGPKSAIKSGKIDVGTRYRQCAKALLVVGTNAGIKFGPIGQDIEIVPLDVPGKWVVNNMIRFQVLSEGKPLSFAEVNARYVGFKPDEAWCYATSAGRDGSFSLRPTQPGNWVLRVQTRRLADAKTREQYDFESFTATLSLEINP